MSPESKRKHPWGLVLLLVAAMIVSFFDRGNLAVAAPIMAPELGLSTWSLGLLLSAFFWTYAVSQIGAGWLSDRVEVRWVYAGAFLLWSAATLSTAFMTTFTGLLAMRLLLGAGESVTYPATSRVLAAVIPERRRGLANSLVDLGARLGPALGTMCGALLVARVGWRGLFLITGTAGFVWLVPWLARAPKRLEPLQEVKRVAVPTWGDLLGRKSVWGTCGGLFGANYAWYFLLSWLPSYLVRERQFSLSSVAFVGAVPYVLMAVSSVSGGLLADRWVARGASPVKVRRGFLVTGLLLTAALLPTVLVPRIEFAVAGLFAACFTLGIYASNLFSLTQTLAGPEAAGRWTGVQNACGNVAGIVGPIATGWIVTVTGGFTVPFLVASLSCILGAASFGLLVTESGRIARKQPA